MVDEKLIGLVRWMTGDEITPDDVLAAEISERQLMSDKERSDIASAGTKYLEKLDAKLKGTGK